MKPTKPPSRNSTRKEAKSGKRSLLEFPQKKTASAKNTAQTKNGSTKAENGSATRKKTSEPGNGNGSKAKSAMPVPRNSVSVKRSADALRRLRITSAELNAAPQISSMLKQADGGLPHVLKAMRFAPDEVISIFLKKYDGLPAVDRERVPMEAIALAAGVDINHLLGSVMLALQAQAVNTVKIIAMTSHHKITQARITYGLLPAGERDRTALDTAMGFLPSPKGPTFIGKAIFGSGKNSMEQQDDDRPLLDDDGPDLDRLFPPANAMQEKLTPIRQRLLPSNS